MSLLKTRFLKYITRDRSASSTESQSVSSEFATNSAEDRAATFIAPEPEEEKDPNHDHQATETDDAGDVEDERTLQQIASFVTSDESVSSDSPSNGEEAEEPQSRGSSEEIDDGILPLDDDEKEENGCNDNESASGSHSEQRATIWTPTKAGAVDAAPKTGWSATERTSITIETTTVPKVYAIEWRLDEESIAIGSAKNKFKGGSSANSSDDEGSNGVIEATFIRHSIRFKMELCITGWVNSNRGYAAFYLTIPRDATQKNTERLVARFSVAIKDTDKSKTSSIRDDFHLGVGFPNLCSESVLRESARRNGGELVVEVKIEIFKTQSRVNELDQEIYNKYAAQFRVEPVGGRSPESGEHPEGRSMGSIQSNVLSAMLEDDSFCDVAILSRTADGERKSIKVHKCVLLHSSLVFQRMFSSFVEGQDNVINLEQSLWSHHIIRQLVRFLYLGRIEAACCSDIETLYQLFCAAEYFAVGNLITECCHQFILTLCPESVCYLLLKLESDGGSASGQPLFGHVEQLRFMRKHDILWRYAVSNIAAVKKAKYYRQMMYTAPQILDTLIDKMTTT